VASLASCECSPSFIHPIFGIAVVKGHSNSATPQASHLQPNKTSGRSMAWSLLDRSTIPQPPENTMTPIMLPLASLLRLSLLFGVVFSDHDRCYAPNGELAESFVSCWDPDLGPTGLCCEPGDQCLNNNLCAKKFIASSFLFYRGSCLDSTWSDSACPNFCTDSWQADPKVYVYACTDKDRTLWGCDEHASIKDGPCEFEAESLELPGMRQISLWQLEKLLTLAQAIRMNMPSQAKSRSHPVQQRRPLPGTQAPQARRVHRMISSPRQGSPPIQQP
jgi:hypothetical protein